MDTMKRERWIPTNEFASLLCVKDGTVRRSLCTNGHYLGIVPSKLPNGRLLWPRSKGEKLLRQSQLTPGENPPS